MDQNMDQKFKISGIEYLHTGQIDKGIIDLKEYINQGHMDVEVFILLAVTYKKLGKSNLAFDYYSLALEVDPTNTANLLEFSRFQLQGPNYLDVLKSMHEYLKPARYIEIGVCKGRSFCLANPETMAIGVDPHPQLDVNALPEKHLVINDTSDNYFSSNGVLDHFNKLPFDMAFLDGMHQFEFALRDFMNLEKHSTGESVVFIHDLFPMNAETATRERVSDFWSGDVWKIVMCLSEYRPDLDVKVLPCPPTGLGMVTKLDSTSTVLIDNYEEILKKYIDMPYDKISTNKAEKLKLTSVAEIDSVMSQV